MDNLAALADPEMETEKETSSTNIRSEVVWPRLCFAFIDVINQSVSGALSANSLTT